MKRITMFIASAAVFFLMFSLYLGFPRQLTPAAALLDGDFTLVIDAGHGGIDGGAVSVSGKKECELNLAIAQRTEAMAALLGIPVVMTRDSDISLHSEEDVTVAGKKASDLRRRAAIVQSVPNAVLLSIHQNHFSQEKYHGAQVFYGKSSESRILAEQIQQDLKQYLDPKNHREIKSAGHVYLMEKASCPAVLVECGFLSNYAEDQLLQEPAYQKKLAMTMLRAIVRIGNGVIQSDEI